MLRVPVIEQKMLFRLASLSAGQLAGSCAVSAVAVNVNLLDSFILTTNKFTHQNFLNA